MKYTADFHIHSKYSRATSRDGIPEILELWARRKGLDLIGTGDFTHPAWREELKEKLRPAEEGLYMLKDEYRTDAGALTGTVGEPGRTGQFRAAFDSDSCRPRFILSAEISSIYKKNGKTRKVHNVIMLPALEKADELSRKLEQIGNIHSDGRPILGLSSRDLLEITLEVCPEAIFIPAHIWTPHFSLFGAYSGFDSIEECFEDLTPHIYSLETGLSSDPAMNWRLSALDRFTLVSNSDAHSPSKLAREANLFNTEMSYPAIAHALSHPQTDEFLGTLEFYPEEGKYHLDGHRSCNVCLTPSETIEAGGVCPVCGKRITQGVLHRIEELADREEGYRPPNAKHFECIVPLAETIAASVGMTAASKKVQGQYETLLHKLGSELSVLRQIPIEELQSLAGSCVAEGIRRVRNGEAKWEPGYDGRYGSVTLLSPDEISWYSGQLSLFSVNPAAGKAKKKNSTVKKAKEKAEEVVKKAADTDSSGQCERHYGLNDEQWAAVTAVEREIAVVAGPGTGKTRTLIYRIRYLIEERNVSPGEITAVTFTNKAAAELRTRLEHELSRPQDAKKVNIGTFHGLCLGMLTKWRGDVSILDEAEALSAAEEIKAELELEQSPRDLLQAISNWRNGLSDEGGAFTGDEKKELLAEAVRRYSSILEEYGVLDYDDLLLEVLKQFEADERPLQKERKALRRILVDEFQDINPVQSRLLSVWEKEADEIFVIGDPDQAIYGFRGSDFRCFSAFSNQFPACRMVRLSKNYRSRPEILACAAPVINCLKLPKPADMRTWTAERESGGMVRLLTAESAFSEALYTAKEINRMVGGIDMLDTDLQADDDRQGRHEALGFSDIAVLYRTHRQAALFEECFHKEGIPYKVIGRDKFLTDPEVRTALAFFRTLLSPQDKAAKRQAGKALGEMRMAELCRLFSQHAVKREKPHLLLDIWIAENGLLGNVPLENLRNTAVCHKSMSELLQIVALGQEGDVQRSGAKVYHSDAVSLMTFHAAKGLEFPVVFLCGVNDSVIPLQSFHGRSDRDEERRLFYVGMTRAKDELRMLTSAAASPFLKDIPEDILVTEAVRTRPKDDGKQLSLF